MTRSDILQAATACVTQDRNNTYGPPEDSFAIIGQYWSTYLGVPVGAAQVGTLLALMKIARLQANPGHTDSYVDLAGYAACAGEIATAPPVETPRPSGWVFGKADWDHLGDDDQVIGDSSSIQWGANYKTHWVNRLFDDLEDALRFPTSVEGQHFSATIDAKNKLPIIDVDPLGEVHSHWSAAMAADDEKRKSLAQGWHTMNDASRTHQTAPDPERGGWRDTVSGIEAVCADEDPLNQPT